MTNRVKQWNQIKQNKKDLLVKIKLFFIIFLKLFHNKTKPLQNRFFIIKIIHNIIKSVIAQNVNASWNLYESGSGCGYGYGCGVG